MTSCVPTTVLSPYVSQLLAFASQFQGEEVTTVLRVRHLSLREAEYLTHRYMVSGWQSKDFTQSCLPHRMYTVSCHTPQRVNGQRQNSDKDSEESGVLAPEDFKKGLPKRVP